MAGTLFQTVTKPTVCPVNKSCTARRATSRLRGIEGSNAPFPTGESCRRGAGYRPAASRRRRATRICFTS